MRNGDSRRRYIWIHGDEDTARRALDHHLQTARGWAFYIESSTREVSFGDGRIDPNRMFSRSGAVSDFLRCNPQWTPAYLATQLNLLDEARETFLNLLLPPPGGLLVSVHNNSQGYSLETERDKSQAQVVRSGVDLHDFFLCVAEKDFAILQDSPYNVILQAKNIEDDGSLSCLAARRGVRYVNCEVSLGNLARQQAMLAYLDEHLD